MNAHKFFYQKIKNRVSSRLLAKIRVSQVFWDSIKNRVSPRSLLLKAVYLEALLYIYFVVFNTTSSVKLFEGTVQIFGYNCVFRRDKKNSRNLSKKNYILKIKAHSEIHFENESTFLEK